MPKRKTPDNTSAERQRRFRERQRIKLEIFEDFRELTIQAFEHGASEWIVSHLPDDPQEWMILLAERFAAVKLVAHEREEK